MKSDNTVFKVTAIFFRLRCTMTSRMDIWWQLPAELRNDGLLVAVCAINCQFKTFSLILL